MITITVRIVVTSRVEERGVIQKGYVGVCWTGVCVWWWFLYCYKLL